MMAESDSKKQNLPSPTNEEYAHVSTSENSNHEDNHDEFSPKKSESPLKDHKMDTYKVKKKQFIIIRIFKIK